MKFTIKISGNYLEIYNSKTQKSSEGMMFNSESVLANIYHSASEIMIYGDHAENIQDMVAYFCGYNAFRGNCKNAVWQLVKK